jgi:putative DNA primase/helicase
MEELRNNNSGVSQTAYHQAKQIEATPGVPVRNGDVLVPGYDAEGKLWTVQYIKEDGTKRFTKNSRKHGCFHVKRVTAVHNLEKWHDGTS